MLREWFIERMHGYSSIEDAIDAIRDKHGAERYELLTLAVRRLFNTIGPEDILKISPDGKTWLYKGRMMNAGEMQLLKAEAVQLLQSKLWQVLQEDAKFVANRKMFVQSKSVDDLVAGKELLYLFDVLRTRLQEMVREPQVPKSIL